MVHSRVKQLSTPMVHETAFFRAICESPADDTARLVYSDWLEDRAGPGDLARAEFIRLQIRLATMQPWHDEYDDLKRRERVLLNRYAEAWLEPVRPWLHPTFRLERDIALHGVFRRGFVETILVDEQRFLADPDGLFDAAPMTGLLFFVASAALPTILESPHLSRIERLRFHNNVTHHASAEYQWVYLLRGDARRIAECPHLSNLRELDLTSQGTNPDGLEAIAHSPHLANLERLTLAGRCIYSGGLEGFGRNLALPALRHLNLNQNPLMGPTGVWNGLSWLRRLHTLDLGLCEIAADEMATFLASSPWPELESLTLGTSGPFPFRGLGPVVSAMPRLAHLSLAGSMVPNLTDAFAGARFEAVVSLDLKQAAPALNATTFFETIAFPRLRVLNLFDVHLEDGLAAFARTPTAIGLRSLDVRNTHTGHDEHAAFARTARLPNLRSLALGQSRGNLTPRVVRELGTAEGLPGLRSLTLPLSASANVWRAVAEMPLLRQLDHLCIQGRVMSQQLVSLLTETPGFQGPLTLRLQFRAFSAEGRRRLRDHFGDRLLR